jgi:cytoskeletal protein CcmA (bactofilin family)
MAKGNENYLGAVNLIAGSTRVTGNIITESDIRIDGEHEGNIITKGRLLVGQNGRITGEIQCMSAEIEGMVRGKLEVETLLNLKATANFDGEIVTGQLQIEAGAIFAGNCKMNRQVSEKTK